MAQERQAPPAGNTGALTPVEVWIDYVRVTFPDDLELGLVLECLGGADGWMPTERGALGYSKGMRKGSVSVWYEGREGMGIHVEASGKGCRELEAWGAVRDWIGWVRKVWEFGGRFSRFDVALDDRSGWLDMGVIEDAVRKGAFVSRWRSGRMVFGWASARLPEAAETVYFGSRSSLIFGRIYNKALQIGVPEHWNRAELEMKDERAEEFLKLACGRYEGGGWQAGKGFAAVACGVWRNYLAFVEEGTATRKERCHRSEWWLRFLQHAEALSVSIAKVAKTLDEVAEWLNRQVATAFDMCLEVFGTDWFSALLLMGQAKRKRHHQGMVNAAKEALRVRALRAEDRLGHAA
jgi:phage replication initiation protein